MNVIVSTALSTGIGIIVGMLFDSLKKERKKYINLTESIRCLLRSEITAIYYYSKEQGFIKRYEKENINYLFEEYKKLGGNSYVASIVKELDDLPVEN